MKELSIKEKAKRYDEAIERARALNSGKHIDAPSGATVCEYIFPELRESKDRMMLRIIEDAICTNEAQQLVKTKYGLELTDLAYWLEKQGKQVNPPQFTFNDVLALQCVMETVKKVQEDKELYEQLQSLHGRLHDAYWLEKQREQKPDTNCLLNWSEEDEKIYASIIDDTVQEAQLDEKQIDWLRNIKYRNFTRPQKQWKPSDDQMEALDRAQAELCSTEYDKPICDLIDSLNKLKEE